MLDEKKFSIRRFSPQDIDAVTEINKLCLPENYSASFFLDIHKSFPEAFLMAEASGKTVGYIMCRIDHGFSDFRKFKLTKKGHIVSVAVIPEYRRLGVGTSLVVNAMKAVSNSEADECFLEVRVTNQNAINLYRKLGFNIARRASNYYFDGEDAYVMSRMLP